MRLLLACTELGLGHAARLIPLGKRLQTAHDLYFYSGGTAYELLRKEFQNVYPCTPVAWYETAHGVIASASLLNILFPLPYFNHEKDRLEIKSSSAADTIHRYYDLRQRIPKINPDLIIADGDMHALRLAHRWKIPSVYVTNVIRPSYAFSPLLVPGERFTELYVKKCTKIVIPDIPKKTVCEYNLGNLDSIGIKDKVCFAGSFLDMTYEKGSHKHIFAPISGPLGTRAKLARIIIPTLSKLEFKSIVSLGEPNSRLVKVVGNCEIYGWLKAEERNRLMKDAKIVVFSGGHGTCFEVIKYRKPSVCIPTQPEQMGNSKKLQELNCSILAKNEEQLAHALMKIEDNIEFHRQNVEELSEFSSKFAGLDEAIKVIEDAIKS
jgi:uncharacterized protein (TIGR00661 family)